MAASALQAVLCDVDGTLAETERDGHRVAFNAAFKACGLSWHWDEAHYGHLLRITGGRERVLHDMHARPDAPASDDERDVLARAVHAKKNAAYADIVARGLIPIREGVASLMSQCHASGVRMGIATTTSRANVSALLKFHLGTEWAQQFAAVVCGEDVLHKKPDPAVYIQALRLLDINPINAVAIEDSPAGAAAARAAGIAVIVTRSAYFKDDTIEGALAVGPGLHTRYGWQPQLAAGANDGRHIGLFDIEAWRAAAR